MSLGTSTRPPPPPPQSPSKRPDPFPAPVDKEPSTPPVVKRPSRDGATSRYFSSPSKSPVSPHMLTRSPPPPVPGPGDAAAASRASGAVVSRYFASPKGTNKSPVLMSPQERSPSISVSPSGGRHRRPVPEHYSASRLGRQSPSPSAEASSPVSSLAAENKTPLEIEAMDFQHRFPGSVVVIECGYRLRFFGHSAEVASQVLGILVNRAAHRVPSASIPTHRVAVHSRRLLEAGQKVVLIRQAEFASLRKRKHAPDAQRNFVRVVAGIFTPGTGISESHPAVSDLLRSGDMHKREEHVEAEDEAYGDGKGEIDEYRNESDTLEVLHEIDVKIPECEECWVACVGESAGVICIMATNLQSHIVRHTSFSRDLCHEMLFGALDQLQPKEIVFRSHGISDSVRSSLLSRYSAAVRSIHEPVTNDSIIQARHIVVNQGGSNNDVLRITEISGGTDSSHTAPAYLGEGEASSICWITLSAFLDSIDPSNFVVPGRILELKDEMRTFSYQSLREVLLYSDVQNWNGSPQNEEEFRSSFAIDPVTINDLCLIPSARHEASQRQATVFEAIDSCVTAGGSSLLRSWLINPLSRYESIVARQECVSSLVDISSEAMLQWKSEVTGILKTCRDVKRFIISLRRRTCSYRRFVHMMGIISETSSKLHLSQRKLELSKSDLSDMLQRLELNDLSRKCIALLSSLLPLGGDDANTCSFSDEYLRLHAPELIQYHETIHQIQENLALELSSIRSLLQLDEIEFITMRYGQLTLDYVIEIPVTNTNAFHQIPKDWVLINSTKSLRRYQTPKVMEHRVQLDIAKASLTIAMGKAWQHFLQKAVTEIGSRLNDLDNFLCEVDALLSLARVASLPGYVRPKFHSTDAASSQHPEEGNAADGICIIGGRHIIVDHLISKDNKPSKGVGSRCIPNNVKLSRSAIIDPCGIVLSGPNMGGKSVYSSMAATIVILAQMGSYVPAESVDMCIVDAVLTANSNKHFADIPRGLSSFAAELDRVKFVLSKASSRSLVVVDELGRGASVAEGSAIAVAVQDHLSNHLGCMSIFVTHFPLVSSRAHPPRNQCFHMGYLTIDRSECRDESNATNNLSSDAADCDVVFLFTLKPGVVPSSLGLHVARLAGLDESLIATAREFSKKL